jgi:hypothetical protein
MTKLSRLRAALALLALSLLTVNAQATQRADFFDPASGAKVEFDRASLTWTLRNQAIERVVHFDTKTGALQTTSLTDLRHNRALKPVPNSEGALSFQPALMEPPHVLATGWKSTDTVPASEWTLPGYGDGSWTPTSLPFQGNQENKTWWFRYTIPNDRMVPGHAYALILDHTVSDEADVYVDGTQVGKITAAERPWTRTYQYDLVPKNRVIAIKLTGHSKPNGLLGTISIAEVGSAPPPLDLSADWKYMISSINAGEEGSQVLTISLSGLHKYDGFDLDVNYQIYPGDEPMIAKWFMFVSHRSTRYLMEQAVLDRWMLPGVKPVVQQFPGTGFAAADPVTRDGVLTAVLSPMGESVRSADGKSVAVVLRPFYLIKPDTRQMTPKALVGLYQGTPATGAFLYQVYIGQYVAHATATSVPPLYNTRYGYNDNISAAICEQIIPVAEELGVKLFVIDEGWQTNISQNTGKYGDWVTDRRSNKFPLGLMPISTLVREHNMRFGLWTAPIMVSQPSQAATAHSDWLLQRADGSLVSEGPGTWGMCFTSGWAENYTKSMLDLCRELTVSFLKLDDGLFEDGCVNPTHEHPVEHSLAAQIDQWNAFCDQMRNLDPTFILDRSTETGPEVTSMQDEGWFGEWELGYDDKRMTDPHWWYKNADIYRQTLYDLTWTRPPFTIAWETPCHIPTNPIDLNALEYHFTSVGAYICNVEIHGKLDAMTPPERRLMEKWIQWNEDNRPWLAYTQPLASLGKPWDPRVPNAKPHIDGVLHLRNALKGRYGYICLWNPGDRPDKATVAFRPSDYFLRMDPDAVEITRIKDGKPVKVNTRAGEVVLPDVTMAPLSWEIFEVRQRG